MYMTNMYDELACDAAILVDVWQEIYDSIDDEGVKRCVEELVRAAEHIKEACKYVC